MKMIYLVLFVYFFVGYSIFLSENSLFGVLAFFLSILLNAVSPALDSLFREAFKSIWIYYALLLYPIAMELIYAKRFINIVGYSEDSFPYHISNTYYGVFIFLILLLALSSNSKRLIYKVTNIETGETFEVLTNFYFLKQEQAYKEKQRVIHAKRLSNTGNQIEMELNHEKFIFSNPYYEN